jgi:Ca-activated chloride channel family protein
MSLKALSTFFGQPVALWLLALVPLFGLMAAIAWRRRRRALLDWGGWMAIASIRSPRARLPLGAVPAGLVCLSLAVARPQWGVDPEPPTAGGRDVVVVLDVSRSMLARDVLGNASPDRLGSAKDGLLDLAAVLGERGGHRIGLVVFAGRASVSCPLTPDLDHFREAVAAAEAGEPQTRAEPGAAGSSGTRIGAGIAQAVQLQDSRFHGRQDIILISDGDDPARDGEWQSGIARAREAGIAVHTVGVGDPNEATAVPAPGGGGMVFRGRPVLSRLEEQPLRQIARETGGAYVPARTRALPLGELFRERIEPLDRREAAESAPPAYRQRYFWFVALGLAFLGLETAWNALRRWCGAGPDLRWETTL